LGAQDKHAEIAGGGFLEEWAPGELDRYLDSVAASKRRMLHRLELLSLEDQIVLDAGCGPGTFGAILAETNQVVGVDISKRAVVVANTRARKAGVRFVGLVGDLELLPFRDGTFDVCFGGWVMHHFADVGPVIRELTRVLKPDGLLALFEPNEASIATRFSRFLEDRLDKVVLAASLDTPSRSIHTPAYYAAVLRQYGFGDVRLSSCYSGEVPVLPCSKKRKLGFWGTPAVRLLLAARHLLFMVSERVLPQPLNGAGLLITARRDGRCD
jgi:SAM-dependent methyltransferase